MTSVDLHQTVARATASSGISHSGSRRAEIRELKRRGAALIAKYGELPPRSDAGLVEAERQERKTRAAALALYHRFVSNKKRNWQAAEDYLIDYIDPLWMDRVEFIYYTPATGLVGAAVKLRMLADPNIGMDVSDSDDHVVCVKQLADLLTRLAAQ